MNLTGQTSSRQDWTERERESERVNYFLDKKIETMWTKTKLLPFDRNKWSGYARIKGGAWEDEFAVRLVKDQRHIS